MKFNNETITKKDKIILTIIYIFILFPISVLICIYNAWLFTYCWKWFVVPFGLKNLSLFHALGLLIMTLFIIPQKEIDNKLNAKQYFIHYCGFLLGSLFISTYAWLVCWIIHNYI